MAREDSRARSLGAIPPRRHSDSPLGRRPRQGHRAHPAGAMRRIDVLAFAILLPSGLQIFNAHPELHWEWALPCPTLNSLIPGWVDRFGGRQSARTLHFAAAVASVMFVVVHVFGFIVTGAFDNLWSMIAGRYRLSASGDDHPRWRRTGGHAFLVVVCFCAVGGCARLRWRQPDELRSPGSYGSRFDETQWNESSCCHHNPCGDCGVRRWRWRQRG